MTAPASAVRRSLAALAKTYTASLGILLAGGVIAATLGYAVISRFAPVTMILIYLLASSMVVGIGTGVALGRTARIADPDTPWSTALSALACLALSVGAAAHLSNIDLDILIPLSICAVGGLFVELRRTSGAP